MKLRIAFASHFPTGLLNASDTIINLLNAPLKHPFYALTMIILWSEPDLGIRAAEEHWLDDTISEVEHQRTSMLSYIKTAINDFKDGAASGVYNHYVCSPFTIHVIGD